MGAVHRVPFIHSAVARDRLIERQFGVVAVLAQGLLQLRRLPASRGRSVSRAQPSRELLEPVRIPHLWVSLEPFGQLPFEIRRGQRSPALVFCLHGPPAASQETHVGFSVVRMRNAQVLFRSVALSTAASFCVRSSMRARTTEFSVMEPSLPVSAPRQPLQNGAHQRSPRSLVPS